MNYRSLSCVLLFAAFVLCIAVSDSFGQSDSRAAARKVFESNNAKVFGVKSLVKLEASFQGKQVMNREVPAYGIGTVIDDGLLVASYRTIKPKAQANIQGAQTGSRGIDVETVVKEIKLIDETGEEFDARLVLHDEDLDLAFVALNRDSENAESWSCEPVDINEDIELNHLDDVIFISRASESMKFQSSVRMGQVNTIIKRPRRMYSVNNLVLGGASFNMEGQFVGLGIRKTSGSGGEFSALLPAKYIRKLVPQAIEKAKQNASSESTDPESDDAKAAENDTQEGEGNLENNEEVDSSDGKK